MKLLVIDNKLHRHSFHYDRLSDEFPNIEIVENIEENDLLNTDFDIIIVHRNNKELDIIEQNTGIGKLRIIFSGNLQDYQHNRFGHYVPLRSYNTKVKSIINDFQLEQKKFNDN